MPIAKFQMPDGRIARFEVPEGTTPEQAQALMEGYVNSPGFKVKQAQEKQSRAMMTHEYVPSKPRDMYARQTENQGFGENLLAGFGGALTGLFNSSLPGQIMQDPQAAFQAYAENKPIPQKFDVPDWKQSMSGLRNTAGGSLGEFAGYAAPAAVLGPIAGSSPYVAGIVGGAEGALLPSESFGEKAANAVIGFASGAGGQKIANKIADKAANRRVIKQVQPDKALNTQRDNALTSGMRAGYKVPPSAAGKQSIFETIGGQIKTQQTMADANQKVTDRLVRRELGMTNDMPLTSDTMRALRAKASGVYGDIRKIDPTMDEAVTALQKARHEAFSLMSKARSSGDPEIRIQAQEAKRVADALESGIEEGLKASGKPELLNRMKEARTYIAKSFDVEDAIHNGPGEVDAITLGRLWEEGQKGIGPRLTGELGKIGEFASTFKESAKLRTFDTPRNSALDYATSALAMSNATNPTGLFAGGLPLLRGPARSYMMREGFQNGLLPKYNPPSVITKAMPYITDFTPVIGGTPLPIGRAVIPSSLLGGLLSNASE